MELIDDEGRLFGLVNIIDALVLLLVVAVVVAGVALVTQSGDRSSGGSTSSMPPTEVRYVTVDLGKQAPYVASAITPGDRIESPDQPWNFTITDVYATPAPDGQVLVDVRARIHGLPVKNGSDVIMFAGNPLKFGRTLNLDTEEFTVAGPVTAIDRQRAEIETAETAVQITVANVRPGIADSIETGMTETVTGQQTARITDVRSEPAVVVVRSESGELLTREHPINRTVYLSATLETRQTPSRLAFHGEPLRVGSKISLDLGTVTVSGTVSEIG